jgi:putative ABC transport system permease protein
MRAFRLLLTLYPRSFRNEYGRELESVIRLRMRDAGTWPALVALWISVALDTVINAARAHADILRYDLRVTARSLGRAPGFAVTAVLVAGLGIGATTAAFSVLDHMFVRALPYPAADRLVEFVQDQTPLGYPQMELSPVIYRDWTTRATSFASMAAYTTRAMNMVGSGEPIRLRGFSVTASFFDVLGVDAALGRVILPEDDRQGAAGTVVLGHETWQTYFGGDRGVVGRAIDLDGEMHTVVGVMPADFEFPTRDADFYRPFRFQAAHFEDPTNYYLYGVARLRNDATFDQASAELDVIAAQLDETFAEVPDGTRAAVWRLRDDVGRTDRLLLAGVAGASLCVLLIGCANLGSLLLTRAVSRERELAIRAAMGAGRERLVRQLLTESSVLAIAGGLFGVGCAVLTVPVVAALVPTDLPIAAAPGLDLRMLTVAAVATIVTGIAFGVLPAYRASRQAGAQHLRDGERAGTGRRSDRLQSAFIVAEVAASVTLLVIAGLLLRSLWGVERINPGFDSRNVITMQTPLPLPRYEAVEARRQFYTGVFERLSAVPGIESAAFTSFLPIDFGGGIWPVDINGGSPVAADQHFASLRYITPRFFQTLRIPLLDGRDVAESDTIDTVPLAVVSRSFADRHWPNQSPLGRRFTLAFFEREVVGVVEDIRVRGVERTDSEPQVYLPYGQVPDGGVIFYTPKELVVRTTGAPEAIVPELRRAIGNVDPQLPIAAVRTLDDVVADDTASRRIQAQLLTAFAAVAVLLTAIGIHGLLAFTVSMQQRELGVRIALGATPGRMLRLVVGRGLLLAIVGAVIGLVAAIAAAAGLRSLLFGIAPSDPLTFGTAAVICLVMACAGAVFPALRAVRIDPIRVIRG